MADILNKIVGLVIALIVAGVMLPIGLTGLTSYNGTYYNSTGTVLGVNSTVGTMVSTIIPIMIVIGIILALVAYKKKKSEGGMNGP